MTVEFMIHLTAHHVSNCLATKRVHTQMSYHSINNIISHHIQIIDRKRKSINQSSIFLLPLLIDISP